MVRPDGFEPPTPGSEDQCSNPLSYGRLLAVYYGNREGEEAVVIIRNLEEANRALLPYVPLVAQLTGKDVTLERIVPLMALLGNPQDRLKVVHIAGTSGKTSTAYYIAALLNAAGQKTGLTVSPHIDSVAERVQIGGQPLPAAEFCEELGNFLDIIQDVQQPPSYFELLYAFALWVFARRGVDYAVVETGMGGLHDATNVTTRADKVCVITDIGFDHTHILGKTLSAIATQKLGIVHDRNHVFMYEQTEEVMAVSRQWSAQHRASLHPVSEPAEQQAHQADLTVIPDYQRRNWLLAYYVYCYLEERDNLQHLTRQVLQETQQLQIPARMDIRQVGSKTLIMDGAHNTQKMVAFISSFQQLYPDSRPAIMLGLKQGKEYRELVPLLVPLASRVITTTFNTSQDLPVLSMNPEVLAQTFRDDGVDQAESIIDQRIAFQVLLAGPENLCIITGSFYLLSQIRHNEGLRKSVT